ncbi:LbetaH domain-containing protein [Roseiconus lacunae]|uniref:hypothetical protein n=1 Tax=Roseiconus lacunae TaxID=2605694 RepID=UPI001E3E4FFD|nr:hypothetical protein [Roseiconus lacunae]
MKQSVNGIDANRKTRHWSRREQIGRVLWSIASPLFRFSPKPCWAWRRSMLRIFGAKIGKNVRIHPSAKIFLPRNLSIDDWSSIGFDCLIYNLGRLEIGKRTTISQRSHLCGGTHDYRQASLPLIKSAIVIGDDAWVCADAFIGPGITVGNGGIVAARAVAVSPVVPWTIVGGNPARWIKQRPVLNDESDLSD